MKLHHLLCSAGLFVVLLSGCGAAPGGDSADTVADVAQQAVPAAPAMGETGESKGKTSSVGASAQAVSRTKRVIIYTATVDLVVENLTSGQSQLMQLVKSSDGYVAETNVGGASGDQRRGTWKVRVPVEKYEAFMAGAQRLGELQTINSSSQDVTAEFTDVSARIKNKRVEEQRLQELLRKATGKLTEVLQVEKELSRVRGEIEAAQGRIRVLSDLSSLTTVTISMREIKDYVPPAPPTFATEIARQFSGSVAIMKGVGKGLVLIGAAILPWLPLALLGFLVWKWTRGRKQN